jgi:hypothetical protein
MNSNACLTQRNAAHAEECKFDACDISQSWRCGPCKEKAAESRLNCLREPCVSPRETDL